MSATRSIVLPHAQRPGSSVTSSTVAMAGSMSAIRAAWNGERSRANASSDRSRSVLVVLDSLMRPFEHRHVVLERGLVHRIQMGSAQMLVGALRSSWGTRSAHGLVAIKQLEHRHRPQSVQPGRVHR